MDIKIESIEPQPIVGIRESVTMSVIGNRIGELAPKVMAQAGEKAAGPLIARYHTWDGDGGEMEVGVPVSGAVEGDGPAKASTLPGGRAVTATHVGPYEGLKSAWEAVGAWMKEQGLEASAPPWESYMNDPSKVPPEKLETRIVWPVS